MTDNGSAAAVVRRGVAAPRRPAERRRAATARGCSSGCSARRSAGGARRARRCRPGTRDVQCSPRRPPAVEGTRSLASAIARGRRPGRTAAGCSAATSPRRRPRPRHRAPPSDCGSMAWADRADCLALVRDKHLHHHFVGQAAVALAQVEPDRPVTHPVDGAAPCGDGDTPPARVHAVSGPSDMLLPASLIAAVRRRSPSSGGRRRPARPAAQRARRAPARQLRLVQRLRFPSVLRRARQQLERHRGSERHGDRLRSRRSPSPGRATAGPACGPNTDCRTCQSAAPCSRRSSSGLAGLHREARPVAVTTVADRSTAARHARRLGHRGDRLLGAEVGAAAPARSSRRRTRSGGRAARVASTC